MNDPFTAIENRLMALEEKLEFQDYTLEKLNEVIIGQQGEIDGFEDRLKRLREEFESGNIDSEKQEIDPPPPHY